MLLSLGCIVYGQVEHPQPLMLVYLIVYSNGMPSGVLNLPRMAMSKTLKLLVCLSLRVLNCDY